MTVDKRVEKLTRGVEQLFTDVRALETDVPATVKTESGTESRSSLLADALSGRHGNMDDACLAGIPDIRVPKTVKTNYARRA
ncbi:hypothetical protein NDU88_007425 [Pleurodeles waltl]|uniref:Uncharacterized protein n=1 Tax=Pleurodeles waltl TaxID=8319 RepID=A0AAV7PPB1_PLEWA|nr:hypothetical protein NDU88_007425 [Pleurodeles waltl]